MKAHQHLFNTVVMKEITNVGFNKDKHINDSFKDFLSLLKDHI